MSEIDLTEAEVDALLWLADRQRPWRRIHERLRRFDLVLCCQMFHFKMAQLTPTGRALVERLEGER